MKSFPLVICPNCGESVPGLYFSDSDVAHCGCYHEGGGDLSVETDLFWDVWEYDQYGELALKGGTW